MERTSEVILRNAARLPTGGILLVNPPCDTLFQRLQADQRDVIVSTQNFGDHAWLSAAGASASFDLVPDVAEACGTIILHLPREKERLLMMLHALSSRMPHDARLWLVGENKAGIKSAPRHLEGFFSSVSKLDNARHCGLLEASQAAGDQPFHVDDYENAWPVEYAGKTLEIVSLPGVFAHGRLDSGSRLLLDTLEKLQPAGKILDFACGNGVIGCAMLTAEPEADLTLLDVSVLAIESSKRTLVRNGMTAALLPSDGLSELTGYFDWIVSNPPFHQGVSNDLEIAADFFGSAGTFLAKNGRIVVVCNRHLPYAGWLRNHFGQVERLADRDGFVILQASQPRK